jgi:peptide chain release factor 1
MFSKLNELEDKYILLSKKIYSPDIVSNQDIFRTLMKEYSDLTPIIEKFRTYKQINDDIKSSKELLDEELEEDFKQLIKEDIKNNTTLLEQTENKLKMLLLPVDPNDNKNVYVEIRGGAGGDEAALFVGDLYRMYSRYAERCRWKTEIMSSSPHDLGGFKNIVFMITGKGAYSRLKYESGVHRVQRIPVTESGGRIHTSTVTVAIMPEAEEIDVYLDLNDVRIDVFRSSGNGGQSVNTTDSAVRITHMPTGIVISCQDEKSQLKNKDKGLKILRAKLYEIELEKKHMEESENRRSQVGTGDRSERIRTYNYPQGRVTDHRINLTLYRLDDILDGDIDELTDNIITVDQAEKLKHISEV